MKNLGYRPLAPETIIMPSWPPGSAPRATQLGRETGNALTFDLDQSTGAGQGDVMECKSNINMERKE